MHHSSAEPSIDPQVADLSVLAVAATLPAGASLHERLSALPFRSIRFEPDAVDDCCRRLLRQRALLPASDEPAMRPSVLGLSRLYRFVAAPLGDLAAVGDECLARSIALSAVEPEHRRACERRIREELVALREDVFVCAFAGLCRGSGCPFAADRVVAEIDRGLVVLGAAAGNA